MRRAGIARLALSVTALLPFFAAACDSGGGSGQTVVLHAFSITSFAGSGPITNQIVFGARAQVAMVATEIDALSIREAGHNTSDWRSLGHEGTFAYPSPA